MENKAISSSIFKFTNHLVYTEHSLMKNETKWCFLKTVLLILQIGLVWFGFFV